VVGGSGVVLRGIDGDELVCAFCVKVSVLDRGGGVTSVTRSGWLVSAFEAIDGVRRGMTKIYRYTSIRI